MACNFRNSNSSALCCTGSNVCEKACIEVDKVFDVCIQQRSVNTTLTVDFGTETAVTILSVKNTGGSTISSLAITPIAGTFTSRVSFTVTTPITVTGTNSAGQTITGTSTMLFDMDIVLRVPQDGVITPEIKVTAVVVGLQNSVVNGNTVTTNACVTIITKVVADVIIVVPSYGYPVLPPCQEYTQDVCSGVFDTPVFPR
jgi:hypothetical protein